MRIVKRLLRRPSKAGLLEMTFNGKFFVIASEALNGATLTNKVYKAKPCPSAGRETIAIIFDF
jgi:hypothetical protein